jgi:VanZ family protein
MSYSFFMAFFQDENLWLYLPLIIWISGIFYLSSEKGSISNTSRYLEPIFIFLFGAKGKNDFRKYHLYFRKTLHFLGYAVLALLALIPFYSSNFLLLANYYSIFAFLTVLLIACADELKQSFYANRHGSFVDVMIDCAGGLTTIFFFKLFTFFKNNN